MKKLTKQERKALYLEAIDIISEEPRMLHFVCNVLGIILGYHDIDAHWSLDEKINPKNLPELFMFKDTLSEAWLSHRSWWELDGDAPKSAVNEYKVIVLLLCVEMCE